MAFTHTHKNGKLKVAFYHVMSIAECETGWTWFIFGLVFQAMSYLLQNKKLNKGKIGMWAPVKACRKASVQHVGTGNFSLS